jgi:hypothetical protein
MRTRDSASEVPERTVTPVLQVMACSSHWFCVMKNKLVIATSTLVAGAIAIALILRPTRSISPLPELGTPEHIPPAARAVIRSRMQRHGEQLGTLVSRVVLLDYEGAARTAGEIYDEPTLARPLTGDELNGVLPERFFVLQDDLRAEARRLVTAAARRDSAKLAEEVGALTKSCISCHDLYLHGAADSASATPSEHRPAIE